MPNGNQFSTGLQFGLPELGLAEEEQQPITDPLSDPTVNLTTRPSQTIFSAEDIGVAQANLEAEQARNAEARNARNEKISGILAAIGAGLAAFGGNQQLASQLLSQQATARQARAEREFAERQAERQKQNQRELIKLRGQVEKDLAKFELKGQRELAEEQREFVAGESDKDRELRREQSALDREREDRRIDVAVARLNQEAQISGARLQAQTSEAQRDRADRHFQIFLSRNMPVEDALLVSQVTSGQISTEDLDPASRKNLELRLSTTMAQSPGEAQQLFLARMTEQMVLLDDPARRNAARANIASGLDFARGQVAQGNPNFQGMQPTLDFIQGQADLQEQTRQLDPSVEDTADDTRSILSFGGTRPLPQTDAEYSALPTRLQKQYESAIQVEAEKDAEAGVPSDQLAPLMLRIGIPPDSTELKDIFTKAYHRRVKEIEEERELNVLRTKLRRGEQLTDEEVKKLQQTPEFAGPGIVPGQQQF